MSQQYGLKIPKGASEAVRAAAIELGRQRGPAVLVETVKCHFKTTDQVLTELKSDRQALGPEGQAVSRTVTNPRWSRKPKPATGTASR